MKGGGIYVVLLKYDKKQKKKKKDKLQIIHDFIKKQNLKISFKQYQQIQTPLAFQGNLIPSYEMFVAIQAFIKFIFFTYFNFLTLLELWPKISLV